MSAATATAPPRKRGFRIEHTPAARPHVENVAVPLPAALAIALGANQVIGPDGNVYRSGMSEDGRRGLGAALLENLASHGQYILAAEVQKELAKAWPGHFTEGLELPQILAAPLTPKEKGNSRE
jgi:hypothetical protein